jgi:integrase
VYERATPALYPLFLTAVMTGMRRGELLALQRGDIDWHGGQIHVPRALYKRRFVTPKSRKGLRAIDMAPTLAHTLQGHLLGVAEGPDTLVFSGKKGKPLDPDNMVKREFQPALTRAELRQIRLSRPAPHLRLPAHQQWREHQVHLRADGPRVGTGHVGPVRAPVPECAARGRAAAGEDLVPAEAGRAVERDAGREEGGA